LVRSWEKGKRDRRDGKGGENILPLRRKKGGRGLCFEERKFCQKRDLGRGGGST